jgi:hypothetical protein
VNNLVITPVGTVHQIEFSIRIYVSHIKPLGECINREMSPQSHPTLPVPEQDAQNVESCAIDGQIHVAVLVEIAGHEYLGRYQAAGSMVSRRRWQKRGGKDEASQG